MIKIIELIHILVSFFLSIGGYIIPNKYIPLYLLVLPYIVIDWNDIDKHCWLTKLSTMVGYNDNNTGFLYKLSKEYGINIDENNFTFILYIILIVNWLYAYYRLINIYKIKLFPNDLSKFMTYFFIISWIIVFIYNIY
ncbi:MAG: hypothetical protein CMG26_06790 [Candidatus Marinimicrobia bacterium]|nr:hypothetical protein [Candidatus Neomarinimicrobiota bacterium]